jgi:hypothetical protein
MQQRAVWSQVVVVGLCAFVMPTPATAAVQRDRLVFPVALADGTPCAVVGYLYYDGTPAGRPLQVAVHGATYNHSYWDFPDVNGQRYSYTNGQLVTTFMAFRDPGIDRVGEVTGPALVELGEHDTLFPSGSEEIETAVWAGTKVKVRALPEVGHAFNLALDRKRGWDRIAEWVTDTLSDRD